MSPTEIKPELPRRPTQLPPPEKISEDAETWLDNIPAEEINTPANAIDFGNRIGKKLGEKIINIFKIDPETAEKRQNMAIKASEIPLVAAVWVVSGTQKFINLFAPKNTLLQSAIGAYRRGLESHLPQQDQVVEEPPQSLTEPTN